MPVKPEVVIEYLGLDLEKFETEEDVKKTFDSTFVRREQAHADREISSRATGMVNRVLRSKLNKVAKEFELDMKFDDMDPDEGIETLATTLKSRVSEAQNAVKEATKSGKSSKDIEEIQHKYEALVKERDAFGSQAKEWETKYTQLDTSIREQKQRAQVDGLYEAAISGLKLRSDLPEIAKTGLKAYLKENYRPEFSEDGTYKVLDKDGNPVLDPKKAQTYRTMDSIAEEIATAQKLTGEAPQPLRKTVTMTPSTALGFGQPNPAQQPQHGRVRRVMPRVN